MYVSGHVCVSLVSYSHHFYVNDYCLFDYREISGQVQSALAQLEQERVAAVRRCQRAQEELKKKQNVSYIETHTHTFVSFH